MTAALVVALVLLQAGGGADVSYQTGVDLIRAGRLAEAVHHLRKAVEQSPKNAQAWKALGVAYAAQSDFALAADPFRTACELDPRLEDACYYYGRNAYALNRFELSLEALRRALRTDRRPARVHVGLGQALEALGRAPEAEREFRKAIDLNDRAPREQRIRAEEDPRVHYGIFLFRQGRLDDALKVQTAAVEQHPGAPKPMFELARVHVQLGNLDKAVPLLEKVVAAEPRNAAAHLLLGNTYARLDRPADAQKHLELGRSLEDR